jgi:hypothetical protein
MGPRVPTKMKNSKIERSFRLCIHRLAVAQSCRRIQSYINNFDRISKRFVPAVMSFNPTTGNGFPISSHWLEINVLLPNQL